MKYFAMMVFIKINKIFSAKQEKKEKIQVQRNDLTPLMVLHPKGAHSADVVASTFS